VAEVPAVLTRCGKVRLATGSGFELCGIAPEGAATARAQYQMFTENCGVVEITEEVKRFICRGADNNFTTTFPARSSAYIATNFENKTRADYDQRDGNQVNYLAPDGKVYFWLPNQTKVYAGEWIIFRSAQLCIHLAGLTEHANTRWVCQGLSAPDRPGDIAEGDVVGLSRHNGRPPWVLPSQPRVVLADLIARVKSLPDGMEPQKEPKDKGKSTPPSLVPMVKNDAPASVFDKEATPHLLLSSRPAGVLDSPSWAAEIFQPAEDPARP
jgi:hypothetical protein